MRSDGEKQDKEILAKRELFSKQVGSQTLDNIMKQQLGEKCFDLLKGANIPLQYICHVFAYGSGAIPQQDEDPTQKMVDFILVSNDSRKFHKCNLELNPGHYSCFVQSIPKLFRSEKVYWFQRDGFFFPKGARVFYNTMVQTQDRLIKYGVIETEDLEIDLLNWKWLYIAGRLHKPVLDITQNHLNQKPSRPILQAIAKNRWMAMLTALIMMPSSEFTLDEFLKRIIAHSYKGDIRIGWAEDSQKIDKLVAGAGDALRQIYIPILKKDKNVNIISDSKIQQDCSTHVLCSRLQMLPYFVQSELCNSYYPHRRHQRNNQQPDNIEELIFISHQKDIAKRLEGILQGIVRRSSWQQTLKNALTAGFSSLSYIWPKLRKGILRR